MLLFRLCLNVLFLLLSPVWILPVLLVFLFENGFTVACENLTGSFIGKELN